METPVLPFLTPLASRFWSKVDVSEDPLACWLWRRGTTGNGYGQFALTPARTGLDRTITLRAHRVAWMLHHGEEIPAGLVLDHRCETRLCCNPRHLVATTSTINATAGCPLRAIETLPSGRHKVRFRQERDGRTVETSRTFDDAADAEAFSRGLRAAYAIPERIKAW